MHFINYKAVSATPAEWTREKILSLPDQGLWAVLRSVNERTERFCNQLAWAKAELKRRHLLTENAP
jgi:hypothetical protein